MKKNYSHFQKIFLKKINLYMRRGLILILFFIPVVFFAQSKLPYIVGEHLKFDVSFGPVHVGFAELIVSNQITTNKKSTFCVKGTGRTAFFFDWFFKVRDHYETHIDTSTLLPVKFIRNVQEGGHFINQEYDFYHKENIVQTQDSMFFIPNNAQDMLSAFFYARTFKKHELNTKQVFNIPIFMDDEMYFLEIRYLNNEILETEWGKIDCMVFKPKMQEGRVFQDGEQMKVWISNDKNHLLLKVETKIWAGSIKAVLKDYKGTAYPLSIIE